MASVASCIFCKIIKGKAPPPHLRHALSPQHKRGRPLKLTSSQETFLASNFTNLPAYWPFLMSSPWVEVMPFVLLFLLMKADSPKLIEKWRAGRGSIVDHSKNAWGEISWRPGWGVERIIGMSQIIQGYRQSFRVSRIRPEARLASQLTHSPFFSTASRQENSHSKRREGLQYPPK